MESLREETPRTPRRRPPRENRERRLPPVEKPTPPPSPAPPSRPSLPRAWGTVSDVWKRPLYASFGIGRSKREESEVASKKTEAASEAAPEVMISPVPSFEDAASSLQVAETSLGEIKKTWSEETFSRHLATAKEALHKTETAIEHLPPSDAVEKLRNDFRSAQEMLREVVHVQALTRRIQAQGEEMDLAETRFEPAHRFDTFWKEKPTEQIFPVVDPGDVSRDMAWVAKRYQAEQEILKEKKAERKKKKKELAAAMEGLQDLLYERTGKNFSQEDIEDMSAGLQKVPPQAEENVFGRMVRWATRKGPSFKQELTGYQKLQEDLDGVSADIKRLTPKDLGATVESLERAEAEDAENLRKARARKEKLKEAPVQNVKDIQALGRLALSEERRRARGSTQKDRQTIETQIQMETARHRERLLNQALQEWEEERLAQGVMEKPTEEDIQNLQDRIDRELAKEHRDTYAQRFEEKLDPLSSAQAFLKTIQAEKDAFAKPEFRQQFARLRRVIEETLQSKEMDPEAVSYRRELSSLLLMPAWEAFAKQMDAQAKTRVEEKFFAREERRRAPEKPYVLKAQPDFDTEPFPWQLSPSRRPNKVESYHIQDSIQEEEDPLPLVRRKKEKKEQLLAFDSALEMIPSKRNEDRGFVTATAAGVFDGVSSGGGAEAAQTAQDIFEKGLAVLEALPLGLSDQAWIEIMQRLFERANRAVYELLTNQQRRDRTGAYKEKDPPTLTTASVVQILTMPDGRTLALIGNTGDSRIYLQDLNGRIFAATVDDNPVLQSDDFENAEQRVHFQNLIGRLDSIKDIQNADLLRERGLNEEDIAFLQTEKTQTIVRNYFRFRNVVTEALGAKATLSAHVRLIDLKNIRRVIIMSDGVHDQVRDDQLEQELQDKEEFTAEAIGEALSSLADRSIVENQTRSKGRDDISVAVIDVQRQKGEARLPLLDAAE